MKRSISLIAILSLVSLSALAQRRSSGNVRGGIYNSYDNDIIRIDINNRSRETRTLQQRVKKLERAVNQLQNMVYDLQDNRDVITVQQGYICKMVAFNSTYYGERKTSKIEAEQSAYKKCARDQRNSYRCNSSHYLVKVDCSKVN